MLFAKPGRTGTCQRKSALHCRGGQEQRPQVSFTDLVVHEMAELPTWHVPASQRTEALPGRAANGVLLTCRGAAPARQSLLPLLRSRAYCCYTM